MDIDPAVLPDDIDALKGIVRAALTALDVAKADAAVAQAERSEIAAYIAHLKLQIEKLKRTIYGPRAERTARLLDQMEFELEDLEVTATEDELRAEQAAAKGSAAPAGITRKRPSRDRSGIHPQLHLARYSGILQADAYGGYNKLYQADRAPGPIVEAACWSHARRKFFELADIAKNAKRKAQGRTPAFIAPMALQPWRRLGQSQGCGC